MFNLYSQELEVMRVRQSLQGKFGLIENLPCFSGIDYQPSIGYLAFSQAVKPPISSETFR